MFLRIQTERRRKWRQIVEGTAQRKAMMQWHLNYFALRAQTGCDKTYLMKEFRGLFTQTTNWAAWQQFCGLLMQHITSVDWTFREWMDSPCICYFYNIEDVTTKLPLLQVNSMDLEQKWTPIEQASMADSLKHRFYSSISTARKHCTGKHNQGILQ